MTSLFHEKLFPDSLSFEVQRLIRALSMPGSVQWLGSASLKELKHPNDFDFFNHANPTTTSRFAEHLQQVVKRVLEIPNTFILDIKAGVIEDWRVIPEDAFVSKKTVHRFNRLDSLKRVDMLEENKVISPQEAKEARDLLTESMTVEDFLKARSLIKFHQLRWTPKELLDGSIEYRGHTFDLKDVLETPGLVKIDVNSWLFGNRYTDVSMIYQFRTKSIEKKYIQSLKEDILYYASVDNHYKMIKRVFSLARIFSDARMARACESLLNSDLGILGNVVADMDTIHGLLDLSKVRRFNLSIDRVRFELDSFKMRLAFVTTIPKIVRQEASIDHMLDAIQRLPSTVHGWNLAQEPIQKLQEHLNRILQEATLKDAKKLKIVPLPKKYLA